MPGYFMSQTQHNDKPSVLIATLGSEPQVVTAALDLLLRQGERISEVRLAHTVDPGSAIDSALERLQTAFAQAPYTGQVKLDLCPIQAQNGRPLQDVETPQDVQAAFRFLFFLIRQAKLAGERLHLCIAGGRKTMALFAMAVAQLLCDEGDRLWHLYSAGEFLDSKRMHPQPGDQVHLIEVPFILWSRISPVLGDLGQMDDPHKAVERVRQLQLVERMETIRSFVLGVLTPAEQRVVALLVAQGLTDKQLAGRLSLSARTVEQHLRTAYTKAANHWELESVNRTQFVSLLNLYYHLGGNQEPNDLAPV